MMPAPSPARVARRRRLNTLRLPTTPPAPPAPVEDAKRLRLTDSQLALFDEVTDGCWYWSAANEWCRKRSIPIALWNPGVAFAALERAGLVTFAGDVVRLTDKGRRIKAAR